MEDDEYVKELKDAIFHFNETAQTALMALADPYDEHTSRYKGMIQALNKLDIEIDGDVKRSNSYSITYDGKFTARVFRVQSPEWPG